MSVSYSLKRATQFLDSWLGYRSQQLDLPGFAVGVYLKGETVYEQAFGLANIESGEPLTLRHYFQIGSQSKMFTATAIMQLHEQGQLSLDDAAAKYVVWLSEHQDKRLAAITIRELLWHGAGIIRDGAQADYWHALGNFPDEGQLKRLILESKLIYEPSSTLKYSNLGYGLLGLVIAAVSGQSYREYVTNHIIQPLKLGATPDYEQPSLMATSYTRPFNHRRQAFPRMEPTHAMAAATGWCATVGHVGRFMAAQLPGNNTLLSEASKSEMQRNHNPRADQGGSHYGLGFQMCQLDRRHLIGHSGSISGFNGCTYFDPADQLCVVVLTNAKDAPSMQMLWGIFHVIDYFQRYATAPTPPNRSRLNVRLSNVTSVMEVVATNERIVIADPDEWTPFEDAQELAPTDEPGVLEIKHALDLLSAGETVRYNFKNGRIENVNLAGFTFWPDQPVS